MASFLFPEIILFPENFLFVNSPMVGFTKTPCSVVRIRWSMEVTFR